MPIPPISSMSPAHMIAQPAAGAGKSGGAAKAAEPKDLKRACAEFESLFLTYMLKEMRATVPKSGLISGGNAEALYTSMLDAQLAKEIAHSRGLGLAAVFERQLGNTVQPDGESANPTERNIQTEVENED